MPQLGNTSINPEAQDVEITVRSAVIGYQTPIAYISDVTRLTSASNIDIKEGSVAMPQWGQG